MNHTAEDDWILHVDGASNSQGSGAGLILASPEGVVTEYALHFLFPATNNQVEYEALLSGMKLARELRVKRLRAFTDSQLVSEQVSGEYEARDPILSRYLSKVQLQTLFFTHFSVSYIPRDENARADAPSRLATSTDGTLERTYVEHLDAPSIDVAEESLPVAQEPSWMDAYIQYFTNGLLPTDSAEAKLFRWRASKFLMLDRQLYRRSFSHPLLKCVGPTVANYILREIHEGICGRHMRGRALSHKALRRGYYWPTIRRDATELVRKCDSCQRHASIQRLPTSQLSPLSAPWPFTQ